MVDPLGLLQPEQLERWWSVYCHHVKQIMLAGVLMTIGGPISRAALAILKGVPRATAVASAVSGAYADELVRGPALVLAVTRAAVAIIDEETHVITSASPANGGPDAARVVLIGSLATAAFAAI